MEKQVRDPLADLELQRQRLEETIEKLRKSLRHWQAWEAEYEGLKEEVQALPSGSSFQHLSRAVHDFGSDLITGKEANDLLGSGTGRERSCKQVIDLLSRRVDYVQRNVETIKNQIEVAERKIEAVDVVRKPENQNEEGLPITDIYEELDDVGNVISSRTSHPDKAEPQILEALKKASLNKTTPSDVSTSQITPNNPSQSAKISPTRTLDLPTREKPESSPLPSLERKSVSFASEPEVIESSIPPQETTSLKSVDTNTSDLARGAFPAGEKVIELDDRDNIVSSFSTPTVPDTPEEAALRRQMQAYSMAEVGNIVARLDLDENESEGFSSDEEHTSENEDEHGMSFDGHLSDEYVQQMRDLEQKLNARVIQNVGPGTISDADEQAALDARRLVVLQQSDPLDQALTDSILENKPVDKSVRFAENLDVAPTPEPHPPISNVPQDGHQVTAPVADSVIERTAPKEATESRPPKLSRFKQARRQIENAQSTEAAGVEPPNQPSSSSGMPLADNIVERTSKSPGVPNEFDPQLVRQQVNSEYYRQRNRIIQKQGGFKREKLDDDDDAHEADNGYDDDPSDPNPRKKVSLFKAMRVQSDKAW